MAPSKLADTTDVDYCKLSVRALLINGCGSTDVCNPDKWVWLTEKLELLYYDMLICFPIVKLTIYFARDQSGLDRRLGLPSKMIWDDLTQFHCRLGPLQESR